MTAAATSPTQATGIGLELVPVRSRSAITPLTLRPGRHTLGSDPSCDLCLNVEGVAPQHCLIIAGPQKTIIKALSPLTWINDGPVGESTLRPGDRLIVGPVELLIRSTPLPEADTAPAPSKLRGMERIPPASWSDRAPSVPVPPPLPPLSDLANLLRTSEASFPPPLPPPLPVHAAAASSQSVPRTARTLLRGESTFETRETEGTSAATSGDHGERQTGDGSEGQAIAERMRTVELQEQELALARTRLQDERESLARREARLGDIEQERRILARQLEEMQVRQDREQELAADLERERSVAAALRAELDEARQASDVEALSGGRDRRDAQVEELEGLRREVESLTKKLAGARSSNPESDRSSLLQQRTELLAIRREAQEKLAEQQRMTAELEQARQAIHEEAEEFRRQQVAAEEEFARIEQRMTDLEGREATLSAREQAVQTELGRMAALQQTLAEQSASIEGRRAEIATLHAQLEEERSQLASAQVEAEELQARDEAVAAREAELEQVAVRLEGELQQIEQSSVQQRLAEEALESRRREMEERDRHHQAVEAALGRQRQELENQEQHIHRTQADLDARVAEYEQRQKAQEAVEEALTKRIRQFDDEARQLEERLAGLSEREHALDEREAALLATLAVEPSREHPGLESESPDAASLAEIQQKAGELDNLREELKERQRLLNERERTLEEHMRAIVLADAERAHWTREHDRLASQIAEMEERVEEWRLQEAALAESRVFITSRERAIDARLIELERREARLSEMEPLVPSVDSGTPPTSPAGSIDDVPLDRELEAARLNAESLAHRERELDGKFEALGRRETALDDLAASLRRREAELDEREETLGHAPSPVACPAGSPVFAADGEELLRLENDLRSKVAALDLEKEEIDQLRSELAQHREAFLEQFRNLERERAEFYSDQQTLGDQVAGFEEERSAFLLERQAFEEERLLSEVPLEEDGLPPWNGGLNDQAAAEAAYYAGLPHVTDGGQFPAHDPRSSIHDDEAPALGWPSAERPGRSPFSMTDREPDVDRGDESPATDDAPRDEAPRTAILEIDPEQEEEQPQVQSSDALELRAHLADLFGIDLSRRAAPEPTRGRREIEEPPMEEVQPEPHKSPMAYQQPVADPEERSVTHEDVDVATYMERLLARSRNSMSGAPDPAPLPRAATITPPVAPAPAAESAADSPEEPEIQEEEVARPARRPLQQQEKDAIRGSMDSFREVANRTARAAVARHQLVKLRNTLSTKGMLAGFCGVVTVILVIPEIWGSDRYRLPALGCICLTVIAGLEWLRTKVRIKKLDDFVAEADVSRESPPETADSVSPTE